MQPKTIFFTHNSLFYPSESIIILYILIQISLVWKLKKRDTNQIKKIGNADNNFVLQNTTYKDQKKC